MSGLNTFLMFVSTTCWCGQNRRSWQKHFCELKTSCQGRNFQWFQTLLVRISFKRLAKTEYRMFGGLLEGLFGSVLILGILAFLILKGSKSPAKTQSTIKLDLQRPVTDSKPSFSLPTAKTSTQLQLAKDCWSSVLAFEWSTFKGTWANTPRSVNVHPYSLGFRKIYK